ncbi:MAG: isoleucine--tRNA ligase [Crenarchaeota archaeon]|nr:isoleucine--tRNA ligase [Thermoproteota archaeon]
MPVVGKVEGRYDPHQVEEWVKAFWERENVYRRVKEWSRGKPRFRFLDGPPYTSSDMPHAGTALNKVLKDSILRSWRRMGYEVTDTPGYDCHGLPIEVAVEKRLGVKVKRDIVEKVGVARFIEECKRFARSNIESLTRWFKELGVFMDWDRPYVTMEDPYIEAEWWFVKRAWERGLLEKEYRVVYWCPRCSTTLAEYEVEYRDLEDPSIYVAFPLQNDPSTALVIWTTTPWTLPANMFVMAHPDAEYVVIEARGRKLIVAKERLESFVKDCGIESYSVVKTLRGRELEGLKYVNPLEEFVPLQRELRDVHRVVLAPEFVTMEEGTGLVHAAPGHGFEDFEVAKRIGIERIVCPVNDEGLFTEEAGKYRGMYIRDANPVIIDDLRKLGALVGEGRVVHRYPTCWRCKTPVLLRATAQWVIKVTKLIDDVRREAKTVNWIPKWALSRLWTMLENPKDWVISRQRFWGTPLPIWVCESCGYTHVVGSVEELARMGGSRPRELHRPWVDEIVLKCPKCGGVMRRVPDVADVWMDSGVAFYAMYGHPERMGLSIDDVAADFIAEGHDQTRGWFFSLLRVGVLSFGRAPYRNVFVHGFMLDEKGREMHKSLGNYVGIDEILAKVGRDVFRLWGLSSTLWEDIRFSWRGLEDVKRALSVAWNVFVFASTYMNLDNFDPSATRIEDVAKHMRLEDRWMLSRLDTLVETVTRAMKSFRVHEAARELSRFIVEDVSHWYIKLVRPRVWVEEDTPDKRALYAVLYTVLKTWLLLLEPFAPFIAEYLYQKFVRPAEPTSPISVSLTEWPKPSGFRDEELEKLMDVARRIVEAAAAARMSAGIKVRQPVRKIVIYSDDPAIARAVEKLGSVIKFMANAKEIETKPLDASKEVVKAIAKPRFGSIGPKFRKLAKAVARYIEDNAEAVARDIAEKGSHRATVDGTEIELTPEDVEIRESVAEGFAVHREPWGIVAIDTRLGEEELLEGLARDLVRRIQFMRKLMGLEITEYVKVVVAAPRDAVELVKKVSSYVASETRAKEIEVSEGAETSCSGLGREWEISGKRFFICVERIQS